MTVVDGKIVVPRAAEFQHEDPWKWVLLRSVGKRFGLGTLVETGGYHGGTMDVLRGDFERLCTIEYGDLLFEDIYRRDIPNVLCLKGDSGRVLRQFLMFFEGPALFWLDAHPSGGDSADFTGDSIVVRELEAILDRGNGQDVVLVDDIGHPGLTDDVIMGVVGRYTEWTVRFYGEFPLRFALVTKGR